MVFLAGWQLASSASVGAAARRELLALPAERRAGGYGGSRGVLSLDLAHPCQPGARLLRSSLAMWPPRAPPPTHCPCTLICLGPPLLQVTCYCYVRRKKGIACG